MARQDFPLENSEFLAVALYIATTEHTKGIELHHECWPGGTPNQKSLYLSVLVVNGGDIIAHFYKGMADTRLNQPMSNFPKN